jgi:predicted small metal-binding protein
MINMAEYKAELNNVCGCPMTVNAPSKDELVSKVKNHALDTHGMKEVPAEIANKLMSAIREV